MNGRMTQLELKLTEVIDNLEFVSESGSWVKLVVEVGQ